MKFADIPTRENTTTNKNWWNDLRDAGRDLEQGAIKTASFVIANLQVAPASVTDAVLSSAAFTSGMIMAEVLRGSTMQIIHIYIFYNGSSWGIDVDGKAGSDAGLTFTVTAGGQVQYTSTNTSAGVMKWAFQWKVAA